MIVTNMQILILKENIFVFKLPISQNTIKAIKDIIAPTNLDVGEPCNHNEY
jgi:hypothetical protein